MDGWAGERKLERRGEDETITSLWGFNESVTNTLRLISRKIVRFRKRTLEGEIKSFLKDCSRMKRRDSQF